MAIDTLIADPTLRPLLQTSQATLSQTLDILTWLSENTTDTPPSSEAQLSLSKQLKKLYALLAQLRGQNRRAAFGVRATKQETAEARQEVDRLLLQLQNLYYEQRHLMGEIEACEGYEYVDLEDPLPEQDLMPLRIEHEKQEREKLEQQRLELVKVKEGLGKENARKKDELRKMDERLDIMIDGMKPLEAALDKEI